MVVTLIAVAIPLIVIFYLILMNFVISYTKTYTYDIGTDDVKKNILVPSERVLEIVNGSRSIIGRLVYFDIPATSNADKISLVMRFNYTGSSSVLLGIKDNSNYSYFYKPLYDSFLENLGKYQFNGNNIYQVNGKFLPENEEDIPAGSLVYSSSKARPIVNEKSYEVHDLTITTGLRGKHEFYVYTPGNFSLKVKKQDLNWYNGTDILNINLYNLDGGLIANSSISDDGIMGVIKGQSFIQQGYLNASNLIPGIYRLEFTDFDGIIDSMELNTNKIVSSRFYLADWDGYRNGSKETSQLYFKGHGYISFLTYHSGAFQQVSINDQTIVVNSKSERILYKVNDGVYTIFSSINDLIVSFPGYASFSEDSYFEPFLYNVRDMPKTLSELDSADYVISNYRPTEKDNGWFVSNVSFLVDQGYIKDGKQNFALSLRGQNGTLILDWIKAEVRHEGII